MKDDNGTDLEMEGRKEFDQKENIRRRFADILAALIKARGCSQGRVADEVGMDKSYLSRIVNAERSPPSAKILISLAKVLSVTHNFLLMAAGILIVDEQGNVVDDALLNARLTQEIIDESGKTDGSDLASAKVLRLLRGISDRLDSIHYILTTIAEQGKQRD